MGRKRKNGPAVLVSVFSELLWGQEQGRARDGLVTEECVFYTVPKDKFLLSLPHPTSCQIKDEEHKINN